MDDSPPVQSGGSQQGETAIMPTSEIKELENGFSAVQFEGDDGFAAFLAGGGNAALPINDIRTRAVLYAPLDGMNAAGLAVSVNMIEDAAVIERNTDKPDITSAVRLLLIKAANVEEALGLCRKRRVFASLRAPSSARGARIFCA